MIADSHIHLTHHSFDGTFPFLRYDGDRYICEAGGSRPALIEKMKKEGIAFVIEPGIGPDSNEKILQLAHEEAGFVYPALGVHPTRTYAYTEASPNGDRSVKKVGKKEWSALQDLAAKAMMAEDPKVRPVAIGELGLDYHQDPSEQHRLAQVLWFWRQLGLAHRMNLPLVLHIRQAHSDALKILRLWKGRLHGGVCHCFYGDAQTAKAYTDLGFVLGIGGTLLMKEELSQELEEAIRQTPIEYLILETDGPYVKPECPELSGKAKKKARNTSLILRAVAERIAELKQISPEEVERITLENTRRIFHIE